jgi:hypothetical protein
MVGAVIYVRVSTKEQTENLSRAMFTDILGLAREFSPFGAASRDR